MAGERRVVRIEPTDDGSRVSWERADREAGGAGPVEVVTLTSETLHGVGVDAVRLVAAVAGRRH